MRDRVDAFGVVRAGARAHRRGPDRGQPAGRRRRRARRQAGRLDRPALLLRLGEERPRRELQDQRHRDQRRPAADHRPLQRGQARLQVRHPRCRRTSQAAANPRFYAFDKVTKKPFANGIPGESRAEALDGLSAGSRRRRPRSSRSSPACSSCASEKAVARARPTRTRFWIIRDNPGLSGTDIKNPEQNFDQQAGNEPIVTFDFTDKGRKAFQTITARGRPARRRQRQPAATRTRRRTRSTSRSRSTTSSSRRRTSTTARTRTASTARPAPRSPAASRSRARRTSRRSSRSARCRCGSS